MAAKSRWSHRSHKSAVNPNSSDPQKTEYRLCEVVCVHGVFILQFTVSIMIHGPQPAIQTKPGATRTTYVSDNDQENRKYEVR